MTSDTARPALRRYLSALVIALTALAVYLGAAHAGEMHSQANVSLGGVPDPQGRTWA